MYIPSSANVFSFSSVNSSTESCYLRPAWKTWLESKRHSCIIISFFSLQVFLIHSDWNRFIQTTILVIYSCKVKYHFLTDTDITITHRKQRQNCSRARSKISPSQMQALQMLHLFSKWRWSAVWRCGLVLTRREMTESYHGPCKKVQPSLTGSPDHGPLI